MKELSKYKPFEVIEVCNSGIIFAERTPWGIRPSRPMTPEGWRTAQVGMILNVTMLSDYSYRILPIQ